MLFKVNDGELQSSPFGWKKFRKGFQKNRRLHDVSPGKFTVYDSLGQAFRYELVEG